MTNKRTVLTIYVRGVFFITHLFFKRRVSVIKLNYDEGKISIKGF